MPQIAESTEKKAAGSREGSRNPRFGSILSYLGFLGSSANKESPAMQETPVRLLGQEDPLEQG